MRASLASGDRPCHRRQSHVALARYGRMLRGLSGYPACPVPPQPTAVVLTRLEAAADAMGSFVQKQANTQSLCSTTNKTVAPPLRALLRLLHPGEELPHLRFHLYYAQRIHATAEFVDTALQEALTRLLQLARE